MCAEQQALLQADSSRASESLIRFGRRHKIGLAARGAPKNALKATPTYWIQKGDASSRPNFYRRHAFRDVWLIGLGLALQPPLDVVDLAGKAVGPRSTMAAA